MDYYSPLRYPGGKAKLSNFIKLIFRQNSLCDGCYVEPYAGGASVALSLLFNDYANKVIINDLDRSIYAFWYSVLYRTDALCRKIESVDLDIQTWLSQREIQRRKRNFNPLDLGFSTFYLNRTNRSGIISGGVIGGLNQTGQWKMDARFNKSALIERIRKIASHRRRIQIYNLDACELLQTLSKSIPRKTLFYLDPPYYKKGQDLYVNHYKIHDHAEVANQVKKCRKSKWIVSYDYTPEIIKLYDGLPQRRYSIDYSAAKVTKGEEVMIFSNNLLIPRVLSPLSVAI